MRTVWRVLKWSMGGLLLVIVLLLSPVAYVETFCSASPENRTYSPIIKDAEFQRREANTYLTYPEWHIVYAYEGLAKILESDDEHAFGYFTSVQGFWTSFCALNQRASQRGGGDFNTRATIHTIGVSFTFEMAMKALYEETVGRVFALARGAQKSPQDDYSAEMAANYAEFLQQVPWYKFDFDGAVAELWEQPMTSSLRGWERRLGLGGEWKAKAAYAQLIAEAVSAVGPAKLRIRSVISGLDVAQLKSIKGVDIIDQQSAQVVIETPRYRQFTIILQSIARAGGQVVEIAGNDRIMASVYEIDEKTHFSGPDSTLISRVSRDGFGSNRLLVEVKLDLLATFINKLDQVSDLTLEHVYDY